MKCLNCGCTCEHYLCSTFQVGLSSVADTEGKLKLAMGYLLHKDLYEAGIAAEYDAYIKKQKKKLLPIAQEHGLTEAVEMLAAAIAGK